MIYFFIYFVSNVGSCYRKNKREIISVLCCCVSFNKSLLYKELIQYSIFSSNQLFTVISNGIQQDQKTENLIPVSVCDFLKKSGIVGSQFCFFFLYRLRIGRCVVYISIAEYRLFNSYSQVLISNEYDLIVLMKFLMIYFLLFQ